ncbi:MAG: zinc-ribbon domain-containing protein, partial [Octadecabacter sp.]
MRMICPNCGAQYEVADDVIPASGRDVQCSNCGHTWFEQPGASETAELGAPIETPPEPT